MQGNQRSAKAVGNRCDLQCPAAAVSCEQDFVCENQPRIVAEDTRGQCFSRAVDIGHLKCDVPRGFVFLNGLIRDDSQLRSVVDRSHLGEETGGGHFALLVLNGHGDACCAKLVRTGDQLDIAVSPGTCQQNVVGVDQCRVR